MYEAIGKYLGVPEEFYDELEDLDFEEDTGNSGEMIYSYYFVVPEHMSKELLEYMNWTVGCTIDGLPPHLFDSDYD
ncbi:hypothetical protein ACTAJO_000727 [Vibrio fluvialis]